jgi:hypothetical protein
MIKPLMMRVASVALLGLGLGWQMTAQAVPSYSRQTGDACTACHVGAFGPQLTPHGIAFKLSGYADSNGSKSLPLSGMLTATFTNTRKDQAEPAEHYDPNNNVTFQELSAFIAGKLTDHIGTFTQITYNAVERTTALDHLDVRYAKEAQVMGSDKPAIVGLSLNTTPTLQDPFNTLPAFSFPYIGSELASGPDAETLLQTGLDGRLYGLTAYTLMPNGIYLEAGAYRDQAKKLLDNIENIEPEVKTNGFSPYGRLAYYKQNRASNYSVGVVAMQSYVRPIDAGNSRYDRLTDVGVDAQYQYLGNRKNIWTAGGSYIHENQKREAAFAAGEAFNNLGHLNSMNINGSYTYDQSYGLSLGAFASNGSADELVYADNRVHKPNSQGYTVEAAWTPFGKEASWMAPWANVRLGLQYTGYTKFNGAKDNYDNSGTNAKDNDTLLGYLWTSW